MNTFEVLVPLVLLAALGCGGVLLALRRRSRHRRALLPLGVTAAVLVGAAAAQVLPTAVETGEEPFEMSVLVEGLEFPWEVVWGPDDHLWVTERQGARVTRVNPEDGSTAVAVTIDEVHVGPQHEGLLGMALHPELLQGTGNDYVYVAYTYNVGGEHEADRRMKIRRYTYDPEAETLGEPMDVLTDLDAWNDHNAGRLVFGPDGMLYLGTGDQGGNQFANFLRPINAQRLPTASQVSPTAYEGKVLRIDPEDGGIPEDNPVIEGVRSHVFTYGHRNPQGLAFGPDGTLYQAEHGPRSDDELNVLEPGANYGWPHVAGYQDDQAYTYANWSAVEDPSGLQHNDDAVPESVPQEEESSFEETFVEPIATFFTVPDGYDFASGCGFVCWPTIAPSSIAYYAAGENGVQAWDDSVLITTLKHGAVYRVPLAEDGRTTAGDPILYFNTQNRYRDLAISPDGSTFYVATDSSGSAAELGTDQSTTELADPGAILVFRHGSGEPGGNAAQPVVGGGGTAEEDQGQQDQEQENQDQENQEQQNEEQQNEGEAGAQEEAAAPDGASDATLPTLVNEGQQVFAANCVGCHGAEGQGGAGPSFVGNANLADTAHVLDVIHHGAGFMPPFGAQLSDRQIAAVATFVRSSWDNDFGIVTPEEAQQAR